MPIRWYMMICPAWTTMCCAVANPPAMSSSARPLPCWLVMHCKRLLFSGLLNRCKAVCMFACSKLLLWQVHPACRAWRQGRAIDLAHVGKSMDLQSLVNMHARKTGDLITASVRMGYVSNPGLSAVEKNGLEAYAHCLGLAYQVIDDILDVESTSDVLGKTSGKDALNNKPTMVSLMGLSEAKALLAQLREQALTACMSVAAQRRAPLETLVELITNRKS
jgi:geranylgeranyl pyrophosphate synthase